MVKYNSWQYNGVAPWNEIYRWCLSTYGTNFWTNGCETIFFASEKDKALFLLRWA